MKESDDAEPFAAAMRAVGTKAPIAVRLAARLIDEGAATSLGEGLRMEIAHLHEKTDQIYEQMVSRLAGIEKLLKS